jgi:hypothetical protein
MDPPPQLQVVGYEASTEALLALVTRAPALRALCLPHTQVTDQVCLSPTPQTLNPAL